MNEHHVNEVFKSSQGSIVHGNQVENHYAEENIGFIRALARRTAGAGVNL